jgi:FkbM family methyltransferase
MMTRIQRGLTYLRDGTLPERLRWKWDAYIERRRGNAKRKRIAWWESQIGKREYLEVRIEHRVRLRLWFDSQLSKLIYCGDFEQREREFLRAFLKPGDVFIDVGANIGLFTLIAAHRVGPAGQVYALEPCSVAYQRLLASVRLNHFDHVSCHKLALSDRVGQSVMTISLDGFDAWNSLGQPSAGGSFAVETVDCKTLDAFAQAHNLVGCVTMIKIDVEGWEDRVLVGGREMLSRKDAPVLQVEFTDQNAQLTGSSCKQLYHTLEDLGYQMFIYDAKSKRLIPDPLRESYPYLNLIAAKQPERIVARLENCSRFRRLLNHALPNPE